MYKKLFFSGLLSSLAFAPFYLFPVFFFTLKYLLESLKDSEKPFLIGWVWGFGYFIGNCYWYCHSLLMWPYYFLIPFAITIIPAFLACYIGLTTLGTKKFLDKINNRFIISLIFSALWIFFEYLRSFIFTGFPWNLVAYSLGFAPLLIQTVHIYGCYIFGFVLLTIFTCFYTKYNKYAISYYIIVILFILSYGILRVEKFSNNFNNFKVITTNISTNTSLSDEEILKNLLETTLKENLDNIDYILWPEAVFPSLIRENDEVVKFISEQLQDKTLITGAVRLENRKIYNSLLVIKNGEIVDFYDKYKLVPFGEYIPFRNIFPFINALTTTIDISKGNDKNKLIKLDNNLSFSSMICYESIFPNLVNKDANFIINITNDAWFGKTSGPYQHLEALRFRAVENGIPAFRVSNGGVSAFIDKYGNVQRFDTNF